MPTYDYECKKCHHEFQVEATMKEKESLKPVCPKCKSTDTSQLFKKVNYMEDISDAPDMPDTPDDGGMPPGMGGYPGMCGPGGYCGYPGM
jgi:putative FmdB family regulatory protein